MGKASRAKMYLYVTLGAALVVTVLIYNVIGTYHERLVEAQRPDETIVVPVASRVLIPGMTIEESDLTQMVVPVVYRNQRFITEPVDLLGRVVRQRVLPGEFFREERLADRNAGTGLVALIARDMRAYQLPVKGAAAIEGFLDPGNSVDVIVTVNHSNEVESRILMEAIQVLAIDDRLKAAMYLDDDADDERSRRSTVTVAVTPEQAEQLAMSVEIGEIDLALRRNSDVGRSLRTRPKPAPEPEPAPVVRKQAPPKSDGFRIVGTSGNR